LWVERLELVDFRSYRSAELDLTPGVTVIVGPNGRGKTNIVEALHRVAVGSSHRIAGDVALVRDGAVDAVIRTALRTDDDRRRTVDVQLGSGRTRVQVDGQAVRRAADAIGVLRVVAFAPEDLSLVRGDPADRRRYLDQLLSQRRASYAAALVDYERVLRQRNTLLKDLRGRASATGGVGVEGADDTLAAWTEQLVAHGAPLVAARLAAVAALRGPVTEAHARLTGTDTPVELAYRSDAAFEEDADVATIADALRAALAEVAREEMRRGVTLIGPHRDELVIMLEGRPARTTASQGEAWSVALACKVGSAPLLTGVGDRPLLLLDDVFSELDEMRRARVAQLCEGFDQVVVTAAVDADVPLAGRRVRVRRDDAVTGSTLHPDGVGGAVEGDAPREGDGGAE
jgi:DNA replication and repair protein RecF